MIWLADGEEEGFGVTLGSVLVLLSFPSNNSAFINKLVCLFVLQTFVRPARSCGQKSLQSHQSGERPLTFRSFKSFRSFRSITCFNTPFTDDWQVKLEEALGARENPMINEIQNDEKGDWDERRLRAELYWSDIIGYYYCCCYWFILILVNLSE